MHFYQDDLMRASTAESSLIQALDRGHRAGYRGVARMRSMRSRSRKAASIGPTRAVPKPTRSTTGCQ